MLAMWIPELPFQLRCRQEPSLRDRPLAFFHPEAGRIRSLWLLNRQARREGLRDGDSLDQALRRCPGLKVLEPAPQVWWEAQAGLEDFLQRWSPQGQVLRLGEALLDLSGTERLFGPERDTARRLRKELQDSQGWSSHGGLSRSATAAQLAAGLEHELEWIPEGHEAGFLAPQPLRRLRSLAPRLQQRLQRLGLHSFGDAQPLTVALWQELVPAPLAPRLRAEVRGEDRPALPLLGQRPGTSRHPWRLGEPCLPQAIALARWCLSRLWADPRHPRRLSLRWWDVDGEPHFWKAPEESLAQPPLILAREVEQAFRQLAQRRLLVREVELRIAWGLGRPRALFQEAQSQKLERLEPALARLRRRFPQTPVHPGWMDAG